MQTSLHAAAAIAVMSLTTILLRFLPFWLFNGKRAVPPVILYLGQVLPNAALGMLVIYCLRDLRFAAPGYGLPELIACALVILVQSRKHNSILSILAGTLCYMALIRI